MAAASFVTDVLANAGRLEKEDISLKLSRFEKRIEEVKVELFEALERKYGDFYPFLTATVQLTHNVNTLSEEMQSTSNKIEKEIQSQLKMSTSEFQDVTSQLAEANALLDVLKNILSIHESLQTVDRAMNSQAYGQAVSQLQAISSLLQENSRHQDASIAVLQTLHGEYALMKEKLVHTLSETWSQHLKWSLPADNKDSQVTRTELSLLTGEDHQQVLQNVINAMHRLHLLDDKMRQLSERLLNYVILPLFTSNDTKLERKDSKQVAHLVVSSPVESHSPDPVAPADAFKKLGALFKLLNQHILGLTIENEHCEEADNTAGRKLLHEVGGHIGGATVDLIIKQCLAHSIPTSSKELENYNEVIQITETFQTKLHKLGFISEDNVLLTDYVKNVNVLFANKKSQAILQRARDLMTADIHNMVQVRAETPLGTLGTGEGLKKKTKMSENMALKSESQLHVSTFRMATCMISEWVQSLVVLAYETLHEATTSSAPCAVQLFYSVRNVFELFCNVVPTYHKDRLENLPQLAALHHNNCIFIAHHLLTLGHQFRPQLPPPLNQGASTYVDMVPHLRRLGTECFLHQMTAQKSQLLQYLRSANGFDNVSEDENLLTSEKAIKQALHQLMHLNKVWKGVLPDNVYCKAIGTLLNSMVVEILGCITALEDISTDDAVQLHALLKVVTEKAPELFTFSPPEGSSSSTSSISTDKSLSANVQLLKCVAKWTKLQEVMLVLMSSLQDIADRWLDGKGPLAHTFSANEIKQLIRALFQNTERRANILAKIR